MLISDRRPRHPCLIQSSLSRPLALMFISQSSCRHTPLDIGHSHHLSARSVLELLSLLLTGKEECYRAFAVRDAKRAEALNLKLLVACASKMCQILNGCSPLGTSELPAMYNRTNCGLISNSHVVPDTFATGFIKESRMESKQCSNGSIAIVVLQQSHSMNT